jgi:hypothetical protein
MLTALILICSITTTPDVEECNAENARAVMRLNEPFASPVTCAMHGQAYVAETAIGQSLHETDRIKIVCMQAQEADELIAVRTPAP